MMSSSQDPEIIAKSSRRRFLKVSALAASAPLFLPARVLGRGDAVPPSERIGLGFIGMGGRGTGHMEALLQNPGVQVLAVCDPYRSKRDVAKARVEAVYAEKTGQSYQGCQATADFREILERPDIDAVVVASPEYWHALHMAMAVKAGKDVYGEKALTLTVAEGRALCQAVRRYARILQVGTQQRSDGNFRFACELARNGYLGDLKRIKVGVPGGRSLPNVAPSPVPAELDYDLWLGPAPFKPYNDLKCTFNWYFIYDYCAGWIQSWGVHHVDIAQWGAPSLTQGRIEVEGTASFPQDGLADTSVTWLVRYVSESGLELSFSDESQNKHGCRFEGDKGWVHVDRSGIWAEPQSILRTKIKPDEEHLYESRDHHGNFLECIRSRKDPVAPVEAGHISTTLTLVGDIATRLGRKLVWDWPTQTFAGDEAANRMLSRPMRSPWNVLGVS